VQSLFWTFLADTLAVGSNVNIHPYKFYKNESFTQTIYHKDFSNFKRNIFGQKLSERPPLSFQIQTDYFRPEISRTSNFERIIFGGFVINKIE
jgi:hypothetical protein